MPDSSSKGTVNQARGIDWAAVALNKKEDEQAKRGDDSKESRDLVGSIDKMNVSGAGQSKGSNLPKK